MDAIEIQACDIEAGDLLLNEDCEPVGRVAGVLYLQALHGGPIRVRLESGEQIDYDDPTAVTVTVGRTL